MKYLSQYKEQAQTELFNKTGSFFAFSNKQFKEQFKPGTKYVDCGAGLICPVKNYEELKNGLEAIQKNAIEQDVNENGAAAIIEREYFNYETQINFDGEQDARDFLKQYQNQFPELFTKNLIKSVFKNCYQKAVENDWF